MATVYGSKVNNIWRAYMTYTVTTTPTQVKVSITSGLNIPNDGYYSARSFTCTISGTGQTTVSGSIPSKKYTGVLTKAIKSVTYTWNRASTAQTKTIKTVLKGNGESTTSSCSAKITIPALAPATITFNANDGSGTVPSAISTYVGVANTIPSNSLTRTGYTFNGWNTASDGSGTAYATGSTITPTGDVTLYAQWKTTYVKPEIQNLLAFRVADKSGGATPTVTSTGETGFCKFDLVGGANYTFDSASVQFGTATANSMTQSGTTLYGYSEPNSIAQTSAYTVKITVVVTGIDGISRTYTDSTYISKSVPTWDVSANGNSFALGGTARDGSDKYFDCYMNAEFNGSVTLKTALPITSGGTGATTAAAARANLGISDCVVETGSGSVVNGTYNYRMWSSGLSEYWYTIEMSTGVTTKVWATPICYNDYTTWAGLFDASRNGLFTSRPHVTISSRDSQFLAFIPYNITTAGIGTIRPISVNAKSNNSYSFSLYAVGTWK